MKFDVVVGNPPYQEELKNTSDGPVYHLFLLEAYNVADKVVMITPGRFLFDAGKTPKTWNKKMLSDEHLKVIFYEQDSAKVFQNTDIKGGVAVTYRDKNKDFGEIGTFIPYKHLRSISEKVLSSMSFNGLDEHIYGPLRFVLDNLYDKHPQYKSIVGSNGRERRLTTSIFSQLDFFRDVRKGTNDIKIIGLIKNVRTVKYLDEYFIEEHPNLKNYKVLLPKANGTGTFGESLSTPILAEPMTGGTHSFISIGNVKTRVEAEAILKYIRTKFSRTMLGVLKVTQDNLKSTWSKVPLQDFTPNSDIDWTTSIAEIDQQLYKKYGLTEEEITFIETNVKEME